MLCSSGEVCSGDVVRCVVRRSLCNVKECGAVRCCMMVFGVV